MEFEEFFSFLINFFGATGLSFILRVFGPADIADRSGLKIGIGKVFFLFGFFHGNSAVNETNYSDKEVKSRSYK
jgi:hypothetical protein